MAQYILKLFIVGQSPKSQQAIANLQHFLAVELNDDGDITIIDVLEQPDLAEKEGILVTPTLIKESPQPAARVIGDLSDVKQVRLGLGIYSNEI